MASRPTLCDDPATIDADWMQRALAAGGAYDGPAIRNVVVEDLGSATNAFGRLLRCHLTVDGGLAADPATVIVKLPTANRRAFRFAKWMSMHERECLYYRRVARHAHIRSPALLYGDFDEDTHRFVLVLEDLRDLQVPVQAAGVSAGRARLAVREIAKLHGQFWGAIDHPALSGCSDVLGPKFRRFMQVAYLLCLPVVLERFGNSFSPETRRVAEALGPRITAHFASVATGPRTFVHGDYRGENMFFGPDVRGGASASGGSSGGVNPAARVGAASGGAAGDDFAVVDWQGCGLGAGLYDVAYFLGTNVVPADRRRIEREALEEYHDIVCRLGARDFTFDDCRRSYRQNMLSVLMPCILACGGLDLGNRRLHDLVKSGLERALAAMEDLNVAEFLPRGRFPSTGNALSILSRGAYKAFRLVRKRRAAVPVRRSRSD
jgi:aminoglycoside/choline kinase family phosphotransferase